MENNLNINQNKIEGFEGEIFHPSLDIKDGILVLGWRYRVKLGEEKNLFLIVKDGNIEYFAKSSFVYKGKLYFFENDKRKLMRIEERWSLKELNKFLDEYSNLKSGVIPEPREIFEKIKNLIKKYLELEKEIDYSLMVAWIIGTYFFPVFSAYPFLNIKAPKGCGKSQCLNFLRQICFNAIKARPSLAALGDTVDALRGTYLIDQADSLERKRNEEFLDILTDSYKKGGGKRRIINFDKGKTREILEFATYSPKVFASIRELPEDLRDRCLIIPLIRSPKNFFDPDDEDENWEECRGRIYKFLITNYEIVSASYFVRKIDYKRTLETIGRELELWLPLEIMFECLGVANEVNEAKKRFLSQYQFSEYEPSEFEEKTVESLLSRFQDETEIILSPKDISLAMEPELFLEPSTSRQRASKVGWVIKKFNLASEKKPKTREGVRYLFEKKKVENIYNNYFKTADDPISSAISPTPLTPIPQSRFNIEDLGV